MPADPMAIILMYFVLPVWLAASFADWLCPRATHIEARTGAKESLIHLLMVALSMPFCPSHMHPYRSRRKREALAMV